MDLPDRFWGSLADRYELERELGRGGAATVYLAADLRHERRVAIKVLRPELNTAIDWERFLREIKITAQLDHPHILPLLDSGEAAGLHYYIMPYVQGESLRDRLDREGELPVEEARRIALEVSDALGYAHRRGLIHRDIKPENILLSGQHARVADFGIARALSTASDERITSAHTSLGTPAYMSPEQVSGDDELDARSDIYALGCVLYEMLAGKAPFTGETAQAVMVRQLTDTPAPITRARPEVGPALEALLARAMAKDPADRFATSDELRAALTSGTASAARQNRRARMVILAIVIGALGTATVWSVRGTGEAMPDLPRMVVLPFRNLGPPEEEYFADGIADEIRGRLTNLSGVTVIASQSARLYRNSDKTPQQIGEELDVDYILDATVSWQAEGEGRSRIRLRPQLIRAADASDVWSESYDADLTEVFAVQTTIAQQVVEGMGLVLGQGERQSLEVTPVANLDAYQLYLRGKFLVDQADERVMEGLALFERALALDSTFALAYQGICSVYLVLGTLGEFPPDVAFPAGKAAGLRAFRLDSTLALPRLSLAGISGFYDWDWDAAQEGYRRLHELFPNRPADVHGVFRYFVEGEREEGISEARGNVEWDPLNPISKGILGHLLNSDGQYAAAETVLRSSLEMVPTWLTYRFLGMGITLQGRYSTAAAVLDTAVVMSNRHPFGLSALGWSLARSGRLDEAEEVLDELIAMRGQRYVQSSGLALVSGAMGRTDETFEWLERAYEERDAFLLYFHGDRWWSPEVLQDDRYQAFWDRMEFPSPGASSGARTSGGRALSGAS